MYLHTHSSGNSHLRVRHNIGTVHLKEVRLQPESRFTRAGAADDQDVLVSCCSRILGAIAHGQSFCCRQDHVVLKLRVHEGLDISMGAP